MTTVAVHRSRNPRVNLDRSSQSAYANWRFRLRSRRIMYTHVFEWLGMQLYYLFPIDKSISKIYLHSHENRKERNFISKTRVEKFVFFPLRERLLPFNILSSNWNLTRNPRSHPPSKGICTTSTILHRRYKNSTVTVMERRSLLPCLYTHEWRSNGKKRFLALGERSGKAGDTHAHKIGSASPRHPDRIFRERGFYRWFLIGRRGGHLVCVEGYPWLRVLFRWNGSISRVPDP